MTQAHVTCRVKQVKDWREIRQRKSFTTSPTQHETFDLCNRKWWFDRVRLAHLPGQPIKGQIFGTVLHAVAERYLRADDLGRDPETGQPVDLYPDGWHIARNQFTGQIDGEVTPDEQDRIRRMVSEAIQSGVLERQPGRRIEREFTKSLIQLGREAGGGEVKIMGFIDLHTENEVQDHKTSKAPKWFKSQDKLRNNTQALVYAKVLLDEARQYDRNPEYITLRHNQFCTDPDNPLVRKTEVRVTPKEIDAEWERLQGNAREMARLRRDIDEWHHIPDPPSREKACNAYGGCAYRDICYGMESVKGFENRMLSHARSVQPLTVDKQPVKGYGTSTQTNGTTSVVPRPPKGTTMSSFAAKIAQMQGGQQAPPAAPSLNPPTTPSPVEALAPSPNATATAPVTETQTSPPWASDDCRACEGRGFNSAGNPCRICDVNAERAGKPVSHAFKIEPQGDGTFTWTPRDGSTDTGSSPTPSAESPVRSEERTAEKEAPAAAVSAPAEQPAEAPWKAPTPAPAPPPAPAPAPQQDDADDETEGDENVSLKNFTGSPGRPRRGFILCVNCMPTRGMEKKMGGGRYVHYLHNILEEIGRMMVDESGDPNVTHWSQLDVWQRRDRIAQAGAAIAQDFKTDIVVAEGISTAASDLRSLFDAIRPHAGMEIHPGGTTA